MSEPIKHHLVSQVLIRQFIDSEENLYTYSKTDGFNEKKLERTDFSVPDLNTIIDKFGNYDRYSIEKILGRYFETDFPKHYNKLIKAIETNNYSGLTSSLKYLLRMGIIGDMRTPDHQIETHEAILGTFREISMHAVDELKNSFLEYEKSLAGVKNKMPLDFKEVADNVSKLMGEKIYSIFIAPSDSYFFLPDCTSVVMRAQLEEDTILNGELLLNPARPIATVIFPVDSHTIIVVQSAKICPQKTHGIYELSSEIVDSYNKMFLDKARDKVICRDKIYLKNYISRHLSTS